MMLEAALVELLSRLGASKGAAVLIQRRRTGPLGCGCRRRLEGQETARDNSAFC